MFLFKVLDNSVFQSHLSRMRSVILKIYKQTSTFDTEKIILQRRLGTVSSLHTF